MPQIIALFLLLAATFGMWNSGGQPNEAIAKDLAATTQTRALSAMRAISEEDTIPGSLVRSYVSNNADDIDFVTYDGAVTTVTTESANGVPYSSSSLFTVVDRETDEDGKLTGIKITRVDLGE